MKFFDYIKLDSRLRGNDKKGGNDKSGGNDRNVCIVLGLLLVAWLGGCQGGKGTISVRGAGLVDESVVQRYGHVDPRELDENLTDEQLEKMFKELGEIATVSLWEGPQPKAVVEGQRERSGEVCQVEGRKAYLRGRRLISQGRLAKAKEEITKGLQADPNSAALYELLAKAHYQSGNHKEAVRACRLSLARGADRLIPYRILGLISLSQDDGVRAGSLFRRALECDGADDTNPLTAMLRLRLAQTLTESGYLAAAVEQYQQAYRLLRQHSGYAHGDTILTRLVRQMHLSLLTQAGIQVSMGRIEQAAESVREAQEFVAPQLDLTRALMLYLAERRLPLQVRYRQVSALCRYLLVTDYEVERTLETYYQASKKMAKHEDYQAALNLWYRGEGQEGNPVLLTGRQYAYGLSLAEQYEEAEKILLEELDRVEEGEAGLIYRDLARLYGERGRWRGMIRYYGAYLQVNEGETEEIVKEVSVFAGRIEQLEEMLKQGREEEQEGKEYGILYLLGYLAQSVEQWDLAEQYYRQALTVNPEMVAGRRELIELLLKRGKYQEVLGWIEDNGQSDRTDTQMLWFAGRAYAGLEKHSQAAKYYQRIIEGGKEDYRVYLALGEILVRQGKFAQAQKMLLEVLVQKPAQTEVLLRLLELYARWGSQPHLNEQFRASARARARVMLKRWLKVGTDKSKSEALFEEDRWSQAVAVLEGLRGQYPLDKNVGMMLGDLYSGRGHNEQAIELTEKLLEEYPEDGQILRQVGRLYERTGDLVRAGQARRKVWQLNQGDVQALLVVLHTMRQAGQAKEAVDVLLRATQQDTKLVSENISILQEESRILFAVSRQYKKAVELFEKWYWWVWCAEEDSEGSSKYEKEMIRKAGENLIWALTEAQYYDRAILHTKALYQRFSPTRPRGALYLARSLNIRRRYEQSKDLQEGLLRIQPGNNTLRLQWYLTMVDMGQAEAAVADARRWREQKAQEMSRRNLLLFLLRRTGKYDEAAAELRQYLEEKPQNETLQLLLFNTLLMGGEYEDAMVVLSGLEHNKKDSPKWLDAQIRLDIARGNCSMALMRIDDFTAGRKSPEIDMIKVQLQAACGEMAQAAELLKEVLVKEPENIEGRLRYTMYLQRLGRKAEAIEVSKTLLKEFPDNGLIKNNLGYSMIENHQDIERAYRMIQESLRGDPESAPTLDSLGWFYYKKGEFDRGLEYIYQSAAGMAVPDPEVMEHLGDTLYRQGRGRVAQGYWEQAREELKKRMIIERYLAVDMERIEEKIRRLSAGEEVNVAGLFDKN